MNRDAILDNILQILKDDFEIVDPGLDENLTEKYEFDSIDAIALLERIEEIIGKNLSQEQKKSAMDIRTINQICNFIESV
jgi:acyl carrier protein